MGVEALSETGVEVFVGFVRAGGGLGPSWWSPNIQVTKRLIAGDQQLVEQASAAG